MSSPVSHQQLAMFMTPREIASKAEFSDSHFYGGMRQMSDVKNYENKASGLDEAIKKEGVKQPLHIFHQSQAEGGKMEVVDGHHRFVAAMQHHPDRLLPVAHGDDADIKNRTFPKAAKDNDWADKKGVGLVNWDD